MVQTIPTRPSLIYRMIRSPFTYLGLTVGVVTAWLLFMLWLLT